MLDFLVWTALRKLGLAFRRSLEELLAPAVIPKRSAEWCPCFAFVIGCTLFSATTSLSAAVFQIPGQTIVGVTSASQTVSVTFSTGGQLDAVKVLTVGVPNLDFSISGAGTCSIGNSYFLGQSCNFPVTFTPKYPGQRFGSIVLVDASGNVLGATSLVGIGSGPLALFIPGTISTVAGDAAWIYRGDGAPATASPIFLPFGVAVDGGGNLFIADSSNNRIRRVDAASGLMSTVAGNGSVGASGDDGPATSASVSQPSSVTLDGAGNLFFADSANNAIRRVDGSTGIITTVAGSLGMQGFGGDGGMATSALLNTPDGIALDGVGNLYIADSGNNVVRRVNLSSGIITAFAGNHAAGYAGDGAAAVAASLDNPWSITVSASGEVYIADQNNHAIRKVAVNGTITTIAGNGAPGFSGDGGAASAALFNSPASVAIDVAGNIYIADSGNNRVRKINAATGVITTVVGNATETFSGDGGPADQAGLYGPYALVLDGAGNLFISDVFHNRIRMVSSDTATLTYPTMRVNRVSATQNETLENDGNAALHIATLQAVSNSQLDSVATTCSISQALSSALTCIIGAQFAPTVTGNPVQGTISITSDSSNSPQTIKLSAQVLTLDPSTAVIRSSGSPSALGAPVTFTATLTSTGVTPTGTVTFLDGTTSIGTGTLNGSGVAQLTTASLALGTHSITASYAGDSNNSPAVSTAISQVVKNGTTVLLQSNANPSSALAQITLTATATGVSGVPTGTMTFLDGTTTLGTATLNGSGIATFNISTLSVGTHSLKASYGGDSASLANVSPVLSQVVSKSSTSTALSSNNTDATFSTSVIFTATVTSQTAGVPTGTVTFKDGATTIGAPTLNGSGVATLTLTNLSVGSHSVSAIYAGDGNNSTSTSSLVSQAIEKIATSTALTSNANPSAAGANVHLTATLTATLNPSGNPLTGSVLFTDGVATLGTSNVAGGLATLDVAALAIGQHTIVATYSGATDYAGSTSPSLSQTVQLSPTVETLAAAPSPGIAGRTVTLIATITSSGSVPTGGVTFKDGINNLGQGTLNAQGIASFATSTLTAGSHAITGVYAGDADSQPATANLTVIVNQATTAVVLNSSGSPATVGLPLTLRATTTGNGATPSGSVTFLEGTVSLGSAQMDAGGLASLVLSSLTVGTHSLTAVYSGDANDATSTSAIFSQVIQKTTTSTTLTSTSTTVSQGTSVQFAAQVASNAGIPGGTVQFFDGTTLIGTTTVNGAGVAVLNVSNLLVGQHNITAVYSGNSNNGPSTSTSVTQIVQPITIVGLTSDHNPASTGASLTFTAGVSGANTIPTGTITFKDGSSIIGVSTINGAGVATITTSALSAGSHPITASYPGDGNNSASVSAVYTQVLQQASTQTVLSVASSTASYGSSVTISVAVTSSGGSPTGSVTFLDGATALGSANLTPAGTAVFAVSNLSLGQHTLTATYTGDQNDATSTSAPQILTIQKQTVSLTIASNSNPSLGGLTVGFSAALQTTSGTPTGSIAWSDGVALLTTTPVAGNGTSSFTTSALTPGQHTITAIYSGDSTTSTATSNPIVETIQQATSATSLTSNKNPGLIGDAISYSVVVTGNGAQPGGTVSIKDGSTSIGTISLDANGLGALTTSSLAVGSHTLTAVYAGDPYHAASQSGSLAEVVLQGTTSTLSSSSNPSLGGNPVIFTAAVVVAGNVPVTGAVTFKDGATVIGSSPISALGVATYTAASLSPGQHSITASYSGDSLNQPSLTAALIQTVQTVSTTTSLSTTLNPSALGSSITLTAQVNGTGSSPTGTVNFLDGSTLLGSGVVAAGGVATLTISTLTPDQHILLAIYLGDADHLTSTSNPLLQAVLQHTSTTLTSSLNPSLAANIVTFLVSVTNGANTIPPSGTVTLMDGSTVIGTATLNSTATATFSTSALAVGPHVLSAVYAGDAQNFTSTSLTLAETVRLHSSTNVLTASSTSIVLGQSVTLVATLPGDGAIPPSGTITFSSGTTILGTSTLNASGIATLAISPVIGSYNVVATYAGDSLYMGSTSSSPTITVADTTHFTITLNPGKMSLPRKQHSTIQLSLTSVQGFADVLALGCVGLPNAATCTFSTDESSLPANGTQTVNLTIDTGSPLTAGGVASRSSSLPAGITLCLLPSGILLVFARGRSHQARRMLGSLLLLLITVAMAMTTSGCGTLDVNGTPAGNYTFNVTAIGTKTGATQSAPMALTVTP